MPLFHHLLCFLALTLSRLALTFACSPSQTRLITLAANASLSQFDQTLAQLHQTGHQILHRLPTLRMLITCKTSNSTDRLSPPTHVLSVEHDFPLTISRTASWALDRIDQPYLPLDRFHFDPRNCSPHLASTVDIFVIDTGCRTTHTQFIGSKISTLPAPGSHFKSGTDRNGHGTAVAALLVGRETGVAPRANVTCVKAMGDKGHGLFSTVIASMEVVAANVRRGRGTFAVLSLTARASRKYIAMDTAVERAADRGVVTFAAAGNAKADACEFTPCRQRDAVAVAATDHNDRLAKFSNWGRCVEVVAPGKGVLSATAKSDRGYKKWDGTSFATPLVAGVVALMWRGGGGGRGELVEVRRILGRLGTRGVTGWRMPTLDGKCHSGRKYSTMSLQTVVVGCVCGVVLMSAMLFLSLFLLGMKRRESGDCSHEETVKVSNEAL